MNSKFKKYTSLSLRIIIAIVFLLAGSGKFQSDSIMAANFNGWGLGISMMYLVGVAEIVGAILLLIPRTIIFGCFILIIVMLGAAIIHTLNYEELGFPLLNITLTIILGLIILLKKNMTEDEV